MINFLESMLVLSDSLVMFSYQAVWERAGLVSSHSPERTYISSLWQQTNGEWRNVFSQDTTVKN